MFKKVDFGARMSLSLILFLLLAFGNYIIGWTIPESDFWFTFSIIIACASLRGFILPGLFIL